MKSPIVARRQTVAKPPAMPRLARVEPTHTPDLPAANDDTTRTPEEYRPNPLWAVNAALAVFFLVAALIVASG
ncbi:MAG TPA: hypothetical protein VF277_03510 [Steroidobacteraceae bacterium]